MLLKSVSDYMNPSYSSNEWDPFWLLVNQIQFHLWNGCRLGVVMWFVLGVSKGRAANIAGSYDTHTRTRICTRKKIFVNSACVHHLAATVIYMADCFLTAQNDAIPTHGHVWQVLIHLRAGGQQSISRLNILALGAPYLGEPGADRSKVQCVWQFIQTQ